MRFLTKICPWIEVCAFCFIFFALYVRLGIPIKKILRAPSRPKALQKILLKKICFGTIKFVKNYKTISLQSKFLRMFSCKNRDKPVAATLQRKCSGGIHFVIITKIITKIIVPRNYFVTISARMVTEVKFSMPINSRESPRFVLRIVGPLKLSCTV